MSEPRRYTWPYRDGERTVIIDPSEVVAVETYPASNQASGTRPTTMQMDVTMRGSRVITVYISGSGTAAAEAAELMRAAGHY